MTLMRCLTGLGAAVCMVGCAATGTGPGMTTRGPDRAEAAALAERMIELAQPGPEHDQLARLAGSWQVTTTFQSSEPGDPVTRTEGDARNTILLGGRFVQSEVRETWGGQPVDAVVRLGFDRRTGRHTLSRCDSWGTYCVEAEGTANDAGLLVLEGTTLDPLGRGTEAYRFIVDLSLPEQYSISIDFLLPEGGVLTMARSTFTRSGNGR